MVEVKQEKPWYCSALDTFLGIDVVEARDFELMDEPSKISFIQKCNLFSLTKNLDPENKPRVEIEEPRFEIIGYNTEREGRIITLDRLKIEGSHKVDGIYTLHLGYYLYDHPASEPIARTFALYEQVKDFYKEIVHGRGEKSARIWTLEKKGIRDQFDLLEAKYQEALTPRGQALRFVKANGLNGKKAQ